MKDSFARVIHITGASGSGTTTLGRAICERYAYIQIDTDDIFWVPTDPPFAVKREKEERRKLLRQGVARAGCCVITGSISDWGDDLITLPDLVVYLTVDAQIRIRRLKTREYQRFGQRIRSGGDLYEEHTEFIRWAGGYDTHGPETRSRAMHEQWLRNVGCPVVRLDGSRPVAEHLQALAPYLPA